MFNRLKHFALSIIGNLFTGFEKGIKIMLNANKCLVEGDLFNKMEKRNESLLKKHMRDHCHSFCLILVSSSRSCQMFGRKLIS